MQQLEREDDEDYVGEALEEQQHDQRQRGQAHRRMGDQRAQAEGDLADRAGELAVIVVLGPAVALHAQQRDRHQDEHGRGDGEDEPGRGRGEQEAGGDRRA